MEIGRGIRSIIFNGSSTAGVSGLEAVLRAAYFIAIVRLVGPEGYGLWTYAIALYGLVLSASAFGFETVIPFAYGKSDEHGDEQASRAAGLRIFLTGGAAILLAIGALVFAPDIDTRLALLLVAPALIFRGAALLNRSIFIGRQAVKRNVTTIIASRISELVIGVAMILMGANILQLLVLHALSWLFEAALSWRNLRRISDVQLRLPSWPNASPILRKGMPIAILDLTSMFLMSAPLILFQPFARDFAEIGQIGVAVQLAGFILVVGFAFLTTAVPVLSRAGETGDRRLPHYGWIVAAISIISMAAILAAYQVLSQPLFLLVLGPEYELARQLTFYTALTAGIIILPAGFLQMLVLDGRFSGAIIANFIACMFVALGFVLLGASFDAMAAIQLVLLGWVIRAVLICAFGAAHSLRLHRRLQQ